MQYVNSLLDLIGNTPLLRLSTSLDGAGGRDAAGDGPLVLAKVEYLNPGGSVKDRIAERMIEAAEASGELQPGGTIVEPTSGNTGVGLAMVAQRKGYKCVFVCPDKVSEDKRNVLKAYGAEVVVCPTAVAPEHPDSYYNVSDRLASEPGAWKPDQYSNPHNPRSHYETTGPEIWEQTEGRITHFVCGIGTGGTISGVGRYLKERRTTAVQVVGSRPRRLGLLRRQRPSVPRRGRRRGLLARDLRPVGRRPHHRGLRRRLVRDDPPAGPRRRRCWWAARPAWPRRPPRCWPRSWPAPPRARTRSSSCCCPTRAAATSPRSSTTTGWRSTASRSTAIARAGQTVGQVLRGKSGQLPDLVHTHPGETIAEAVHILEEYDVSQMPVVRAEPPIVAAEVAGSVSDRVLLDKLFTGQALLTDPVEQHMSPPMPTIGSTEHATDAVKLLEDADAVLVQEDGKPVGVLTRQDLLGFLVRG